MTIRSRDTPADHPLYVNENGITGFAATDILYPPYSYTLTIDEPPEAIRDGEITHLAELGYEEQKDVSLRLPYNLTLLPHDIGSPDRAEPEETVPPSDTEC